MKVCFVIEYFPPHVGGGETLFSELAKRLVEKGHACDVLTSRLPGTAAQETRDGVRIHRVSVPARGDRYWFTFLALPWAARLARQADVVHTMTYNGAFPAWVAARLARKPVALLAHEVLGPRWSEVGLGPLASRTFRVLEDLVLGLPFDAYPCNSLATRTALASRGIPGSRLHLAYPGVDGSLFFPRPNQARELVRRRLGLADDAFACLYYGRPGVVKGVEHLVAAVPYLCREIPGFRLVLILSRKPAGKRRRVMRLVKDMEKGAVTVLDPVPRQELPDYIAACDCVAVPSLSEGFGFTCAEACAMGKPVVATTAGSLPEVIHGRHVLVAPADPRTLAGGIIRVWKGEVIHKPRRDFSWDDTVARHLEIYTGLTTRNGKDIRHHPHA